MREERRLVGRRLRYMKKSVGKSWSGAGKSIKIKSILEPRFVQIICNYRSGHRSITLLMDR